MVKPEKSQAEQLGEIIDKKLKPFYWMFAAFTAIYGASQYQMTSTVMDVNKQIENKASKEDLKKAVDERERDYMMKIDYYKNEVDEHEKIKEAIENPSRAEYVLKAINEHIRFEMGLSITTTRGGIK